MSSASSEPAKDQTCAEPLGSSPQKEGGSDEWCDALHHELTAALSQLVPVCGLGSSMEG